MVDLGNMPLLLHEQALETDHRSEGRVSGGAVTSPIAGNKAGDASIHDPQPRIPSHCALNLHTFSYSFVLLRGSCVARIESGRVSSVFN